MGKTEVGLILPTYEASANKTFSVEWKFGANFKGAPHLVRDFHVANPNKPRPPKHLLESICCWEKDENIDDHADDNKA